MAEESVKKIPLASLPNNYRQEGAKEFGLSKDAIYAIATGLRKNDQVFSYLLDLAATEKVKRDAIDARHREQLNALTQ